MADYLTYTEMALPMPTDESAVAKVAADRAAIERWEGEGGRALELEKSPAAPPGELPRSDASGGEPDLFRRQRSRR